jgi:hypothetical protein
MCEMPPAMLQRLIAALVVAEGRIRQTDELVGALWDDAPPSSARRVRCFGFDACQLECARVDPHRMLGNSPEHHRVLRTHRVEVRCGRILPFGEVTFIPDAAEDTNVGRVFLG